MEVEGLLRRPVFVASTLAAFFFTSGCSNTQPGTHTPNPIDESAIAVLRETGDKSDIAFTALQASPLKEDYSLSQYIAELTFESYCANDPDTQRLADLQSPSRSSCSIHDTIRIRDLYWRTKVNPYEYQANRCQQILSALDSIDCITAEQRSELRDHLPPIISDAKLNCAHSMAKLNCVNLGAAIHMSKDSMSVDVAPSMAEWGNILYAISELKAITETEDATPTDFAHALNAVEEAAAPFLDHPDIEDDENTKYCLERFAQAKDAVRIYREMEERYSEKLISLRFSNPR